MSIDDRVRRESSVIPSDEILFSPHCCCCGWVEHCLLNYQCLGTCCGSILYMPFMILFYLIWILQIPITILLNLIAFIFCCNFCKCECCRGSLFIADDESVPDHHTGIMLHTAESIKNLHIPSDNDVKYNGYAIQEPQSPTSPDTPVESLQAAGSHKPLSSESHFNNPSVDSNAYSQSGNNQNYNNNNNDDDLTKISILQWNVFGQLGRYWKRYPLLATRIHDLSPDIICLQEAVTVKWSVLFSSLFSIFLVYISLFM